MEAKIWGIEAGFDVQKDPCNTLGVFASYRRGDYATITINEFCDGNRFGLIKGHISGEAEDYFNENVVRKECIRTFTESIDVPEEQAQGEETEELSPVVLRLLLRMLFDYQKTLLKPSERFRYLAITNIIAELVGDAPICEPSSSALMGRTSATSASILTSNIALPSPP